MFEQCGGVCPSPSVVLEDRKSGDKVIDLKQKGATAAIGAFKRLSVLLVWSSAVDLDLMAFYRTKDGRTGGVYSDNYAGGSLGCLDAFPFMALSGDAGVGAVGGDNRETMTIAKLDDIAELYICAVNFTDAASGASKVFADYDARIEVETDRNEKHIIALDSTYPGSVAVLCQFKSNFMGMTLSNNSEVMSFEAFRSNVPGAEALKLLSKVTLQNKGDSHTIQLKQKGAGDEITINLNWNPGDKPKKSGFFGALLGSGGSGIDLDLGCFVECANGTKIVIDGLQFSNSHGPRNRVTKQGCYTESPWVWHMGDDRSGGEMSAGEFILINPLGYSDIRRLTIYAYIYEGVSQWGQTDAVIAIKVPGNPEIVVEMGQQSSPKTFCAIAGLDFVGDNQVRVTRYVTFHNDHSDCDRTYNWGMRWQAGKK